MQEKSHPENVDAWQSRGVWPQRFVVLMKSPIRSGRLVANLFGEDAGLARIQCCICARAVIAEYAAEALVLSRIVFNIERHERHGGLLHPGHGADDLTNLVLRNDTFPFYATEPF